MRRRLLRLGFAWTLAVGLLGLQAPGSPAAGAGAPRHWFGAEGGFDEIACTTPGAGCPGFSSTATGGARMRTIHTGSQVTDPDGVSRAWPARTGSKLFLAEVPGGVPGSAYLSAGGGKAPVTAPVTVSFGLRFHAPPVNPVVIYRHAGATPAQTFALALTPGADLIAFGRSDDPIGPVLATGRWHAITVTYGGGERPPVRVYVDETLVLDGVLPLGAPSGRLDLGIVAPTPVPSTIGIDDIVESAGYDEDIRGARIGYLMPLGQVGEQRWTKQHQDAGCAASAANWQLVSEDQWGQSGGEPCSLVGGSLSATTPGRVDTFSTEGIPSKHQPSASYGRDLTAVPGPGDAVLGVRARMAGRSGSTPVSWSLGIVSGGALFQSTMAFDDGGNDTRWGSTFPTGPGGAAWTASGLDAAQLRLDSATGAGTRQVTEARLDYIWVP